ncbi:hypothetical protein GCM10010169_23550 [Micromonospora fulviviridis]|uniref:hypothetical protein n=1 Tax=Micromonospora fulviviridis TaxID=47860 RepID=UPI001665CB8D|nr:hypothetical protein [Micromonospora fulviviridis]GGR78656.1 hypothetical protein GCM10010169_23550 [Micromonospora fulviviridis]
MSIIASASVPAANRLIDADTAPNLTAIRRPDTNQGRFPTNQPYTGRAAVPVEPPAAVMELARKVDRLVVGTNLTDDEVAARLGVTADEAFDAYEAFDNYRQAFRPAGCPPYCSEDHRGEVTEVDGFTIGLVHERILAELTGQDPGWHRDHPATAVVRIESTTEGSEVTTPTRIVLSVSDGDEGAYDGQDTQAWTGTVEQAEQLAQALLAAVSITRTAR